MSAIEDPEYPERPFIRMFLSGFDNGAWKDASLNWIEETQENAVEVIATSSTGKTVALEHTLIELFTSPVKNMIRPSSWRHSKRGSKRILISSFPAARWM
jgi:hypothetical protein